MRLFRSKEKEYTIIIDEQQSIIVPASFLKILIIDNRENITMDVIKNYLLLHEIQEDKRYEKQKQVFVKYSLTQKGKYFLEEQKHISNSQINKYCNKMGIMEHKQLSANNYELEK